MEALTTTAVTCKNCETTFEGRFCPNCAQSAKTHRFTLKHFLHDAWHAFTHTDKGVIFLIKELAYRPGEVAREYNAGKRRRYFNPITFFLVLTGLNVLISKETGFYHAFSDKTIEMAQYFASQGPNAGAQLEALRKERLALTQRVQLAEDNAKPFSAIFTPILAVFTWLLFRKSGHNYAENLIFNIFITAEQVFFFFIVCTIPFILFPDSVLFLMLLYLLISWVYTFYAYRQFFQQKKRWIILKGIIIQVAYIYAINLFTNTWLLIKYQ